MDWPVYFPQIKSKSTKDLIIRILTEKSNLTNQSIHQAIKKNGITVSYQAVRQALTELTAAKVLVKNQKQYLLSREWIQNIYDFSSFLKKRFLDKTEIKIVDKNTKEIELTSLYDLGHFILHSFKEHFFDQNNENDLFMFVHNLWFPFLDHRKRLLLKDFFSVNKNTIIAANKGLANRVFSVFYKRYGIVKLGVTLDQFSDIIVQGNCVVKIYMARNLRLHMNKLYRSKNPFNFRILDDFAEMTYAKHKIKIIITRDKDVANDLKALFLRYV